MQIRRFSWPKFFFSFLAFFVIIISLVLAFLFYADKLDDFLTVDVRVEKSNLLNPVDPIVVSFSQSVNVKDYDKGVRTHPQEKIKLRWENNNRRLLIYPEKFWKVESDYVLDLPETRSLFLSQVLPKRIEFSTVKYPRVTEFSPANGSNKVILDIEDPVVINFDKSTRGFYINFTINPFSELAYENNENKTQFRLLPKGKVEDGTKYEINVFAKYIDDSNDSYRLIYTSEFETLPAAPLVWEKDYSLRLAQAKNYTRPKLMEGKYIDVNIQAQVLSIFQDGNLLDSFMISSGRRGMDTPRGQFQIYNKHPRTWSKQYSLFMPFWMAITPSGKYGIHELPEWPGGYKEGKNHLGIPVSHGCIRLGVGPAETVYGFAEIGTPVIIY